MERLVVRGLLQLLAPAVSWFVLRWFCLPALHRIVRRWAAVLVAAAGPVLPGIVLLCWALAVLGCPVP